MIYATVILALLLLNLYVFLAVETGITSNRPGWICYVTIQLIMLMFQILGWFLLLPFCISQAWFRGTVGLVSIKDGRPIDAWNWMPLNYIYGNPEDGVSGQCAIVYTKGVPGPYMPKASAWWRAYCWSAWRNSCDSLKYKFAWSKGPQGSLLGYKIGWWDENGRKVPLL